MAHPARSTPRLLLLAAAALLPPRSRAVLGPDALVTHVAGGGVGAGYLSQPAQCGWWSPPLRGAGPLLLAYDSQNRAVRAADVRTGAESVLLQGGDFSSGWQGAPAGPAGVFGAGGSNQAGDGFAFDTKRGIAYASNCMQG